MDRGRSRPATDLRSARLTRLRWRSRGAWLWPAFVLVSLLDGLLLHAWPIAGDSQSVVGGVLGALFANLVAVVLLSRPFGGLLRRRRTDMPMAVAGNYGGTAAIGLVTTLMLAVGLAHQPTITNEQSLLRDAVLRAEAYIGDRAPGAFRRNAAHPDTYTIQAGFAYRTCVPNGDGTRTYCVIVRPHSITFAGYEPNSVFAAGTN